MTDFTSPRVVIRPALSRDSADVTEFTKFIWDGHDYVGEVFREWLADPQGQLLAAEFAGHCVGTAKVTWLAPGQWWLERFRVDPKYQGLKIGSRLDAACNEWWDTHGDGMLRLLTNSKRVKVHHLSEARGFVRVGEVYAYAADPLSEATDSFTPLQPDDADEAVAFCQRLAPNGFMNLGWKFVLPTTEGIRTTWNDEFLFFWWRERTGFVSAWDNDDERGVRFTVGMDACPGTERVELLTDLRRFASARGAISARWMNNFDEAILRDLEIAGYKKDWEDSGYLYERRHP